VYPFELEGSNPFQVDFRKTIQAVAGEFLSGRPIAEISANFHRTMAKAIVDACMRIRESDGLTRVCLSGGTFQNLRLLNEALMEFRERGFDAFIHRRVPTNDGGLSLGQAAIANARLE
jgi:hydrogenase maturation protein HypF